MRLRHPAPFTRRWRARWIWSAWPDITLESATLPVLADPVDRVALLRRSFEVDEYKPQNTAAWDEAYERLLEEERERLQQQTDLSRQREEEVEEENQRRLQNEARRKEIERYETPAGIKI